MISLNALTKFLKYFGGIAILVIGAYCK